MYKVWIVDDEPFVTDGLARQVDWESLNMEIAGIAGIGSDVLAGLADNPAHLLITDVSMPEMDGLTLITKAKQICPSIRCIIISAFNEFEYVKKALQLGVENYLLKPINESELQDTLSKTLENLIRDQMAFSQDSPDVLAFRNNILERWVNGTIQDFELYERAELLNMNLSAPEYIVCVLDVVELDEKRFKFKQASLLLERCRSALHSYMGECFLDSSFRVVVVLFEHRFEEIRAELLVLLRKVRDEASAMGIRIFCSLGPRAASSASVNASYASAVFHLNYRFLDSAAATVSCPSDPYPETARQGEMKSLLLQFNKLLKEGTVQQVQLMADKYLGLHRHDGCFASIRHGVLPLLLTLIRTIIESGRIANALPAEIVSQLAGFARVDSTDQLHKWLSQTIRNAMKVIQDRKKSYHLLVHLTLEQVNKKYASELSLKTLAQSFNVSPAYLGQLFKEETGKYFNDFLTEVRLQVSRTLLSETDLKIGEIVQRIGIPNQSYFNRVFKKVYEVSPMEFRRQNLNT